MKEKKNINVIAYFVQLMIMPYYNKCKNCINECRLQNNILIKYIFKTF